MRASFSTAAIALNACCRSTSSCSRPRSRSWRPFPGRAGSVVAGRRKRRAMRAAMPTWRRGDESEGSPDERMGPKARAFLRADRPLQALFLADHRRARRHLLRLAPLQGDQGPHFREPARELRRDPGDRLAPGDSRDAGRLSLARRIRPHRADPSRPQYPVAVRHGHVVHDVFALAQYRSVAPFRDDHPLPRLRLARPQSRRDRGPGGGHVIHLPGRRLDARRASSW